MEYIKVFNKKLIGLNNNQLKIIALISMVLDHVGLALFPKIELFRILGRLALPIYAYMIAEGCAHTKNRKRYLGMILGMGLIFQIWIQTKCLNIYLQEELLLLCKELL